MDARGREQSIFSPNFKPSVDGNEFYYLKRHWDFDRDASGVICRKLQMVSGFNYVNNIGNFIQYILKLTYILFFVFKLKITD